MNIRNVRFIWKALSIMVDVMGDVYAAVCSLCDRIRAHHGFRMMCAIYVLDITRFCVRDFFI